MNKLIEEIITLIICVGALLLGFEIGMRLLDYVFSL